MDELVKSIVESVADQFIRLSANLSLTAYYFAKKVVTTWEAKGYGNIIKDDDTIISIVQSDGRTPITGRLAYDIVYVCQSLVLWCEHPQTASDINPNPRFTTKPPLVSIIEAATSRPSD